MNNTLIYIKLITDIIRTDFRIDELIVYFDITHMHTHKHDTLRTADIKKTVCSQRPGQSQARVTSGVVMIRFSGTECPIQRT